MQTLVNLASFCQQTDHENYESVPVGEIPKRGSAVRSARTKEMLQVKLLENIHVKGR